MNKNIIFKFFNLDFVQFIVSGALVIIIAMNNEAFDSIGLWVVSVILSLMLFRFNQIFWGLEIKNE